jgi:hypothetical protein
MEQHGDRQGLFPMRARRQAPLFVAALALLAGCWAGEAKAQYGSVGTAAGYLPVGTTTIPASMLGVYGGVTIGSSYISTTAPTNGAIIQGNVGIGTTAPAYTLDLGGVGSSLHVGSGGTFINTTTNGGEDLMVGSGGIQALAHIYANVIGKPSFVMNINGSYLGWMENTNAHTWSLGYGGTFTSLGTSVIAWNDTGNVGIGTTSPQGLLTVYGASTVASSASATLDYISLPAATTTVTGTTGITTANGFNAVSLYKPTITDSSAVTITNAATLYIDNEPATTGSAAITNSYALDVAAGNSYFGGAVFIGVLPTGGQKLYVADSTANHATILSQMTATTGSNYALDAQAIGSGATLNVGGYFTAQNATSNYAIQIPSGYPPAGSNNYAINSQSAAQSYFAGNVGIGTTAPQATLDVNGYARLKLQSSQPVACSSTNQGALALNHLAQMCACNGTSWIFADSVGASCSW